MLKNVRMSVILLWIYCPRKKMSPTFLVHIFTEINPNFIAEQMERARSFTVMWRLSLTRMKVGLLRQRISVCCSWQEVTNDMSEINWGSNGIPSQQMCRQKNNNMRSEIRWVTPAPTDAVLPRILPEKQQKISQLWVAQATEIASLNTRGSSRSVERNCTICIHMLLVVQPSSVAIRQVI